MTRLLVLLFPLAVVSAVGVFLHVVVAGLTAGVGR